MKNLLSSTDSFMLMQSSFLIYFNCRQYSSSVEFFTMTSKMSQEAKKDEFRKYLDKAGVLELLTKSLVQLYEVILFIVYSPFSIYGLFISGA